MKKGRLALAFVLAVVLPGLSVVPARAQASKADPYYAAGNQLYQAKNLGQALKYYQAAVQVDPNHEPSWLGLANCQYSLGLKVESLSSYEKALAMKPGDAQLTQFVQSLKSQVGSTAAAKSASAEEAGLKPADSQSLAQGKALFAEKKYEEAIPYLAQGAKDEPKDGTAEYYLGYSYAMTKDTKNAALHFGRSNQKAPNAGVAAYAEKLKASLSLSDRAWVNERLASSSPASGATAGAPFRKVGFEIQPAFASISLADFKTYAEDQQARTLQAQQTDPSASFDGKVPSGFLQFGFGPVLRLSKSFELGLNYSLLPVGSATYAFQDMTGTAAENDINETDKISGSSIGLDAKYVFGRGKIHPFLGLGLGVMPVKVSDTWSASYSGGALTSKFQGDFSSTAVGFNLNLGMDIALGKTFVISPMVGYRVASATNFKGSASQSNSSGVGGASGSGQLVMKPDPGYGTTATFQPDDLAAWGYTASDFSGASPLKVNLGGIHAGAMISAFF